MITGIRSVAETKNEHTRFKGIRWLASIGAVVVGSLLPGYRNDSPTATKVPGEIIPTEAHDIPILEASIEQPNTSQTPPSNDVPSIELIAGPKSSEAFAEDDTRQIPVTPDEVIPYGDGGDHHNILVYETYKGSPNATVIHFHGGAFLFGEAAMTPQLSPVVFGLAQDINAATYTPNYPKSPESNYTEIRNNAMEAVLAIAERTSGPIIISGASAGGTIALFLSTHHDSVIGSETQTLNRYNTLLDSGRIKLIIVASPPTNEWDGADKVGATGLLPINDLENGDCSVAPLYFSYSNDIPGSASTDAIVPALTEAIPYIETYGKKCVRTLYVDETYQMHQAQLGYNSSPKNELDSRPDAVTGQDVDGKTPNSLNYSALRDIARNSIAK